MGMSPGERNARAGHQNENSGGNNSGGMDNDDVGGMEGYGGVGGDDWNKGGLVTKRKRKRGKKRKK